MDNPNLIPSSDPLYEPISLAYQRTQQPTQADLVQSAARDAIKDLSNWQSGRLPSRPDTYQSYFEDPNKLARYHTLIQSSPEGWQAPEWMDVAGIESAYKWMEFRNNGEPWTNWKPLAEDDPGLKFIRTLSQPPNEILMPNELQYAKVEPTPQELLEAQYKQLGFKTVDWGELPFFAKFYTTMFSPQPMQGRPDWSRGTASAVQGALGGLGGAAVGAAVGGAPGAVLGFLAVGIPSGIQAYTGEEVVPGMSQALNFFNIPAQWAERSMGLINLAASRSLEAVKDNLPAAWEAAGLKYETQQTDLLNLMAAAQQKVEPLITGRPSQIKLAGPNEVWQISKGYAEPVPLFDRNLTSVGPRSGAAMWQAVERINNGESPEIVYADFMSRYGDTGTFNDFISQTVLDPLNLVPFAEGVVGEKAASLAGEPRLAEAFKIGRGNLGIDALPFGLQQIVSAVTGAKGSEGLLGTLRNYKDWVRGGYWSEKALKYLPVDEATGKPIIPDPKTYPD